MKKRGEMNSREILVIGIISIIFCLGLVFATHTIGISTAARINFSFAEDLSNTYNITINNTDTNTSVAITNLTIELPSSFTFNRLTNGSRIYPYGLTGLNVTFANTTSYFFSWTNLTLGFINGTLNNNSFWFNATASTPGIYQINITTVRTNGTIYTTNIPVTINDTTTAPSISFVSPGVTLGANLSQNLQILVNVSATKNYGQIGTINITLYIYNSTSTPVLVNTSVNLTNTYHVPSWYVNFSGANLIDGVYLINATVNDTGENVMNSSESINITLDKTVPVITSCACTPTTSTASGTVTCSVGATDTNLRTKTAGTPSMGYGTHTVTCTATDYAENVATATSNSYTISGGSPGGPGGGSIVSKWVKEIKLNDSELNLGQTLKILKKNYRMTFNVKGMGHQVGITDITSTTVTIEVSSTPQTATLAIGDVRKFDVDADGYYDISVKLNSIIGSDAGLVIAPINEKITTETAAVEQQKEEEAAVATEDTVASSSAWLWVLGIIVVVLIVGGIWYYKNNKK